MGLFILLSVMLMAGVVGCLFYLREYRDRHAIKSALSQHGSQLLSMSGTDKTFAITTTTKWWIKHIRFEYGRRIDTTRYYQAVYNKSGTSVSCVVAVYRTPFMKPQLFFREPL